MKMKSVNEPLISILVAIYNPNLNWLSQQLNSLYNQDYKNLEIIIIDDCSNNLEFGLISNCIKYNLKDFNYKLERNNINLGSNKTFERLTRLANGKYIAYCDQDDIWSKNKISVLYDLIKNDNIVSYCDMKIIDEKSIITHNSLKEIRPALKYVYGKDLVQNYIFANCTAGCSMLVRSDIAKKSIPFLEDIIYDHYICLIASLYGSFAFTNRKLVKHRIHKHNQTGILTGIYNKEDYYNKKIIPLIKIYNRLGFFKNSFKNKKNIFIFINARKKKNCFLLWKYRKVNKRIAYFEIFINFIPDFVFRFIINKMRNYN